MCSVLLRFSLQQLFQHTTFDGRCEILKKEELSSIISEAAAAIRMTMLYCVRSDRRSSWMVRGDFCYSVSGLAQCSHSLETPNTPREVSLSVLASRHQCLSRFNEQFEFGTDTQSPYKQQKTGGEIERIALLAQLLKLICIFDVWGQWCCCFLVCRVTPPIRI